MIVVGCFYCNTRDYLDDSFRRLQPNDLNLDQPGVTHLDHESMVAQLRPVLVNVKLLAFV